MPEDAPISADTLETLKDIPTQTLIDALWVKNWPQSYVEGARPLRFGLMRSRTPVPSIR